ncbi:MAG: hypothetical protein PHD95_06965 [Candidatus ainarchaeum sp.]|nr:hypothetical protein [Candidatus ainarchaeum sp.]
MALSFKYRKELFQNKPRFFPKIPVLLYYKGNTIQTSALLDSGAIDIFIPREIADALELELKNPSEADSWFGKLKIWESRIGVVFGKGNQTFRRELPCNVPDEISENAEVVFGRSFFQFFEITFNENKRTAYLKRTGE